MSGHDQASAMTRPVGRGRKLRAAVRAATLGLLTEEGYDAVTVERVARRAGVHKTSIYRHWTDREALVVDAVAELIAAEIPVPDTGTIDGDLRALARGLVRWLASPAGRAVVAVMVVGAGRVPEIEQARRDFYDRRFREAAPVVTRAVNRGELPAETDPAGVLSALAAPVYFRLLLSGEPLDDETADRAAAIALASARAGVLRPSGPDLKRSGP